MFRRTRVRVVLAVPVLAGVAAFAMGCGSDDAKRLSDNGTDASIVGEDGGMGEQQASAEPSDGIDTAPPAVEASSGDEGDSSDSGRALDVGSLLGVDANSDGVRDDIEGLIEERYPDSERSRAVLRQMARAMQAYLRDANSAEKTLVNARALDDAVWCATAILGGSSRQSTNWLHDQTYNTLDRALAYFSAQAHLDTVVIPPEDTLSVCAFDPSTMAD